MVEVAEQRDVRPANYNCYRIDFDITFHLNCTAVGLQNPGSVY